MVAATKDRDTQQTGSRTRSFGMSANVRIWGGTFVGLLAAGTVQPAALLATTPKLAGVATTAYDNTGGAAGAVVARIEREGVYGPFANSAAGDQITVADIDADCFVVDDQTVAKTSGTNTRLVAGKVHMVEPAGVWVRIG